MQKKVKSVYIIGIGGISLSAIAIILKNRDFDVYGSDTNDSELIHNLQNMGVKIKIGFAPEFVKLADIVIFTSAVDSLNKDILLAQKLGKPIFSRAEILGKLSREYQTISVAGTHGKTTTTGMISNMFLVAGQDPNIHIGGILNNINSNVRVGNSKIFVTEACEYKDSFLQLQSNISIILNIHKDHLDYFQNLDNIFSSFEKFAQNTSKNGVLVYNFDDKLAKKIKCDCKKISFGFSKGSDYRAINISQYDGVRYSFDVEYFGKILGNLRLPCFGKHNIYNALASVVVGIYKGIGFDKIKEGIESFKGIKRRFEYINQIGQSVIIHDYAHHPDEIKATIKTCKEFGYQKIIVVFQPHTFSRTQTLYNQFLSCFEKADEIWLLPIYPAREKPIKGVSSLALYKELKKHDQKACYFNDFDECKNAILQHSNTRVLFAILGAGDIEKLANMLK